MWYGVSFANWKPGQYSICVVGVLHAASSYILNHYLEINSIEENYEIMWKNTSLFDVSCLMTHINRSENVLFRAIYTWSILFLHNSNCFNFRCEGHKLNLQLFSKPSVSVTCIQIIHMSFRCYLLEMDECVFCHQSVADGQTTTTLTEKGCTGIRKASDLRNSPIAVSPGQVVHTKCRQTYVNPRVIDSHNRKRAAASSQPENPAVVLRSSESPFGYDTNCLFCGNKDIYDGKSLKHKLIKKKRFRHKLKCSTSA